MQTTYYTVTVDTEEEWDWSGGWPVQNLSLTNIQSLPRFQKLCATHGAKPTYFVDQAVLDDAVARQILLETKGMSACEIGMHIHPWNTPPVTAGTKPTARTTFLRNLPDQEIRAKLQSVYDALERCGLRPTSFRGGRYSSGGVVHEFLQERGFVAECSVVPFTTWPDDGAPDYRHRDLSPVRIPPKQDGGAAMWELPLTLGFSRGSFRFWQRAFETIERTPLRLLRLIGLAEKLGVVRKVWLNFEIGDPHDWTPFLKLLQRKGLPCICFTVHSSSLAAGPGPYTRSAADEDRIFGQIDSMLAALRRLPGFVPATASEVASHLERQYASGRN